MRYNRADIIKNFRGLIGFQPTYDSSNIDAQIDEELGVSDSEVYLNDLSPLFTAENFANCAQQFSTFQVAPWSSSYTYKIDDVVSFEDKIYRALSVSINVEPDSNITSWHETTLMGVWYQKKYDACVLAVVDNLLDQKKLEGHGTRLRGGTALYNSQGVPTDLVTKTSGRFVGYKISVNDNHIAVTLQRIGLQITGETTVPIQILKNNDQEEFNCVVVYPKRFQWFDPAEPTVITSQDDELIVGYFEDDIPTVSAVALNSNVFTKTECKSCNGGDYGQRKRWGEWITVTPISILDGEETEYESNNWGLNLVLSFTCDLSDILIREKFNVLNALKAQLKITFLEALGDSVRNNQQADQISTLAYNQLRDWEDPDNPKIELKRAMKALSFNFSDVNEKCLPCEKTPIVRYRNT